MDFDLSKQDVEFKNFLEKLEKFLILYYKLDQLQNITRDINDPRLIKIMEEIDKFEDSKTGDLFFEMDTSEGEKKFIIRPMSNNIGSFSNIYKIINITDIEKPITYMVKMNKKSEFVINKEHYHNIIYREADKLNIVNSLKDYPVFLPVYVSIRPDIDISEDGLFHFYYMKMAKYNLIDYYSMNTEMSKEEAISITQQILIACLILIKNLNIIHCDLKLQNLVVFKSDPSKCWTYKVGDNSFTINNEGVEIKVIDYGMSSYVDTLENLNCVNNVFDIIRELNRKFIKPKTDVTLKVFKINTDDTKANIPLIEKCLIDNLKLLETLVTPNTECKIYSK